VLDPAVVTPMLILATLVGAIVWTHACTWLGLPISASHSLVGGLVGAGLVAVGPSALLPAGLTKILLFIVLAPFIGLGLGALLMVIVLWAVHRRRPRQVDRWFRRLQLLSAAVYSLGHGTNDAQKTMGIIAILLYSAGLLGPELYVPFWVVITCHIAIALGTLIGGWRVIQTLGMRITKLRPVHGFCAETAAACSILLATGAGIPVSTTHTITGSIIGVGATTRLSAVRWGVAYRVVVAWLLTIPGSALVAALAWLLLHLAGLA
jgi:PiT family inorganic phosphate transporter